MAINGGPSAAAPPQTTYQGAIALFVSCDSQPDVDRLWGELAEGGKTLPCGSVVDKYGFAWNIVPAGLGELLGNDDREKAQRTMKAMLQMEKLDIDRLREVFAET
jgi:predicted 3-demethylubiquinone-9 3-methyltransferase (glyoxalase superfamily)